MKKLLFMLLATFSIAGFCQQTPTLWSPYCLPASPTVPAGMFVSVNFVQPTANPTTSYEQYGYDQTNTFYYFVTNITTGTGFVTSLVGCPIRYATQQ